ncbi:MAG: hypothetical protein RBR40_15055 [Tenuifilaceae bacterium]|nr:hypothetical protein [Tenuifilaceae bacterium]
MVIISNQLLIDFLRLNNLAINVRNDQLGKQLDEFILQLGGTQRHEVPCGRDNEEGDPFGYPKTSMSYNFPENQFQSLYDKIIDEIT